jgi:hypothetical protein
MFLSFEKTRSNVTTLWYIRRELIKLYFSIEKAVLGKCVSKL